MTNNTSSLLINIITAAFAVALILGALFVAGVSINAGHVIATVVGVVITLVIFGRKS